MPPLCSCTRSSMLTFIYLHTHTSSCLLESVAYWQTHTHTPIPTLDCVHNTHIPTLSRQYNIYIHFRVQSRVKITDTHTHTPVCTPTLDCLHKHTYTSWRVSLLQLQELFLYTAAGYTQFDYLFHKCRTSLLNRNCRIADCTMKHPGVERPFSTYDIPANMQRLANQAMKA